MILTTPVDLLARAKFVLYPHWYVLTHTTVNHALTLTSFSTTAHSDEVGPPLKAVQVTSEDICAARAMSTTFIRPTADRRGSEEHRLTVVGGTERQKLPLYLSAARFSELWKVHKDDCDLACQDDCARLTSKTCYKGRTVCLAAYQWRRTV